MRIQRIDPKAVGRKIWTLREQAGWSLRKCASRAGIAASFLAKVEGGKASPTLMTLQKILEALQTDFGTFFNDGRGERPEQIVYPHSAMKRVEDGDRRWYFAFPRRRDIRVTMTYEEYKPKTRVLERESHPGDMCGYVLEGELTLGMEGGALHRVRRGDAFYVRARRKHVARNEGQKTLKMVVVQLR